MMTLVGAPRRKPEEDGPMCVKKERTMTAWTTGCQEVEYGLERRSPGWCGKWTEATRRTQLWRDVAPVGMGPCMLSINYVD
ncbi:hypothetical protein NDU88_006458 [Pleurodeles waltl]|uniref:Uncharacterized protein n=1 Tax=Pleurodeles waltl TaxID=8319 RepID=A0AAV7WET5_PLEWA|nr:hypothetical protein NDU88_006458 [Pleurodeles waltl]